MPGSPQQHHGETALKWDTNKLTALPPGLLASYMLKCKMVWAVGGCACLYMRGWVWGLGAQNTQVQGIYVCTTRTWLSAIVVQCTDAWKGNKLFGCKAGRVDIKVLIQKTRAGRGGRTTSDNKEKQTASVLSLWLLVVYPWNVSLLVWHLT